MKRLGGQLLVTGLLGVLLIVSAGCETKKPSSDGSESPIAAPKDDLPPAPPPVQ